MFYNLFADSAQLSGYLLHFYQILGNCQYYLDKWGEAKGNYQEALMLTNGKNDLKEKRAILLTQIGNTTNKLGNLEEAIEIYKENLELHQEIFGEDDLEYAATLMNLALLQEKGKHTKQQIDESIQAFIKCLEICNSLEHEGTSKSR